MSNKLKTEVAEEPVAEVTEAAPLTPLQEAQAHLAAIRAEAAPLVERLQSVDNALADLDSAPVVPVEGGPTSLDDEIKARKIVASKRAELTIEREVVAERLAPIQAQIGNLERTIILERQAEAKARAIDICKAGLERVAIARAALDAEIQALTEAAMTSGVAWRSLPDVHFAVQGEVQQLGVTMRNLSAASA